MYLKIILVISVIVSLFPIKTCGVGHKNRKLLVECWSNVKGWPTEWPYHQSCPANLSGGRAIDEVTCRYVLGVWIGGEASILLWHIPFCWENWIPLVSPKCSINKHARGNLSGVEMLVPPRYPATVIHEHEGLDKYKASACDEASKEYIEALKE